MIIFPEITIEWEGEEYTTSVNMKVINRIEQTVSLATLVTRLQSNDVPLSHLATVYGCILRHAGAKVTDDQVYGAMMGIDDELDQSTVISAAAEVLQACFPQNQPKGKKKASRK